VATVTTCGDGKAHRWEEVLTERLGHVKEEYCVAWCPVCGSIVLYMRPLDSDGDSLPLRGPSEDQVNAMTVRIPDVVKGGI